MLLMVVYLWKIGGDYGNRLELNVAWMKDHWNSFLGGNLIADEHVPWFVFRDCCVLRNVNLKSCLFGVCHQADDFVHWDAIVLSC